MHRPLLGLFFWLLLAPLGSLSGPAARGAGPPTEETGLRAPPGFEVTLYADDALAHDIFSMTLDAEGRVVVAGRGYVKRLHDRDGDGRAESSSLISKIPASGAHGLLFDGPDLLCTGDESLMRLRDTDGDGVADGPPEVWAALRHPEHGANGLTWGPDGWVYLMCGNDAGVSPKHASDGRSPVEQPNCGAVLRFEPGGRRSEIVAHGFRNPYDLAFNGAGHLFTVDADGERDQYLPWYAPNRLFDIAPGMHHGWVLKGWRRSWNRPASYLDNVPRLVEIGRGSPTGVTVYRHTQFPAPYRGAVLSCCWTLGRVYRFSLTPAGSSYASRTEVFLETTGQVGFAPVDVAVGPAGELYVAIGGRRTRGSVFRVRYVGPPEVPPGDARDDVLARILSAPQPLAAWSRARWIPATRQLGRERLAAAAADRGRPVAERVRAVEILTELFDGLGGQLAGQLIGAGDPQIAARVAWSLGRRPPAEGAAGLLAGLARSDDPRVARAAWEALATLPSEHALPLPPLTPPTDRRVRAARLLAVARRGGSLPAPPDRGPAAERLEALWRLALAGRLTRAHFTVAAELGAGAGNERERLDALRLAQRAVGDIRPQSESPHDFAGYQRRDTGPVAPAERAAALRLAALFPTGSDEVDRELARLLAMLDVANARLLEALSRRWTAASRVEDDIHYLLVMARLPGARSDAVTARTAAGLARLHAKMRSRRMWPSRNWPRRVGEAFAALSRHDERLSAALVESPRFGLAAHALFVEPLEEPLRSAATRELLAAARAAGEEARWTPALVGLVAALPEREGLPALRAQWHDFTLRDTIAVELARVAAAEDRPRLVAALASVQPQVVERAAEALVKLGGPASADEATAAIRALRQACLAPQQADARRALARLLAAWSGAAHKIRDEQGVDLRAAYAPWFDWFAATYPQAAAESSRLSGATAATWRARLASIDFAQGDAQRGRAVFEKRACAACHGGDARLGPDLAGTAARLARGDLFAAIVDPNRDVSPTYQTSQVVTRDGRTVHGLVVYESPDATLVQTGAATTVRIAGPEILTIRKSRQSLMPGGLLDGADDRQLADLDAYLRTLVRK